MSVLTEIKDSFKNGSVLTRLIYINIGVFLFFRFVQLFMVLSGNPSGSIKTIISFVAVPSVFEILVVRFWTPFTYMFVQFDFFHLIFNILYLYWFGRIFMDIIGAGSLLKVYVLGGLTGALVYYMGVNLVPAFYPSTGYAEMIGASGSVMAILLAVAVYRPNYSLNLLFIGNVRLKYIALVAFIIDLISIPGLNNTGGHLAHLGGSAFGLLYGLFLLKGNISTIKYTKQKNTSWKPFWQKKTNLNVSHRRPLSDMEYNALKVRRQKEVDQILEKIKKSGYESLSGSEKKTLFEASKDSNFK